MKKEARLWLQEEFPLFHLKWKFVTQVKTARPQLSWNETFVNNRTCSLAISLSISKNPKFPVTVININWHLRRKRKKTEAIFFEGCSKDAQVISDQAKLEGHLMPVLWAATIPNAASPGKVTNGP